MKQEVVFELLKKLREKPKLMRKLKILAVVGIIGLFTVGALTIWAGVTAFNFVATKANETSTQNHVDELKSDLKSELKSLPKITALSCWGKAQSLMAVLPWLERPAIENLAHLKAACLEESPQSCEGVECENENMKKTDTGSGKPT